MKEKLFRFVAIIYLSQACASLTTPNGGPKDKEPPELLRSSPQNNQTNFKGKTIELSFNELVKLNNPKEEIIISPSPGKNVDFKVKGTRVTITPEKGWKDSTTYSIVFREGIQDVTEGNSPDSIGLKIAFSTGPVIDSISLSGKVEDLLKGTVVPKITVALYQQDTFNIFTDTSTYFTKTNKNGRYKIENIKSGKYKIYAFDDKNKNLKVESRTERYGFIGKELNLEKNIDSLSLGLIMLDARPIKISSIRNIGTVTKLRFNKYITDYKIQADSDVTNAFGDNQTEITFWNPSTLGDSLQLNLHATDSLDNNIDSTFYIKKTDIKPVKEKFQWSLGDPSVDSETGKFTTVIKFNKPVININLDSLFIEIDDNIPPKDTASKTTLNKPPKGLTSKQDTSKLQPSDTLSKNVGRKLISPIDTLPKKPKKIPQEITSKQDTSKLPTTDTPLKDLKKKLPRNMASKQDTSKLHRKDSVVKKIVKILPKVSISDKDLSIDVMHKSIIVTKELDKKIFKAAKDPRLNLKSGIGFFYSADNDTSKNLSTVVPILWPEDTGILFIEVVTKEKNYIVQLLDKDGRVLRSLQNEVKHTFKNLLPAEYQLRVIIDANKNGKWDPGNILLGVEPENVIFYKTAEKRLLFVIRANWELGPLILKF